MKPEMEAKWEKAFHTPGEKVLLGLDVVCDACEKDWTESTVSGGFLFGSYAYCPDCAEKGLKQVKEYGEEKYLKGFCPENMSFADFVCEMRGPDAAIVVTVGWPENWDK